MAIYNSPACFALSPIVEAAANPNGRFRRLEGIYALTDQEGLPLHKMHSDTVHIRMMHDKQEYTMICPVGDPRNFRERMTNISAFVSNIDAPHMLPFKYFENEMLLFDDRGNHHYSDVVLHRVPSGKRVDEVVETFIGGDDQFPAAAINRALASLAQWMNHNKFSHGKISFKTLFLNPAYTVQLYDYTYADRKRPDQDIFRLGIVASFIYLVGCDKRFFDYIKSIYSDADPDSRSFTDFYLTVANSLIDYDSPAALKELMLILSGANHMFDSAAACSAISRLASQPCIALSGFSKLFAGDSMHPENEKVKKYKFIGELHDMLMRASDEDRWCYLDKKGRIAIKGPFISAEDFHEGRAIVETEEGYGVIDRNGEFIIPPEYDDIAEDEQTSVFIVTRNGQSGLCSRTGSLIVSLIYDQIMSSSESLFAVKKNRRYGYIDQEGRTAVPVIYNDVLGFRSGVCRVKLRDREFIIDTEGTILDEIIELRKASFESN